MSDESPSSQTSAPEAEHWSARHGKSIIFVILTLVAAGAYLAVTIPIAVFPSTDFPRIIVGVDNGVMPIDQMLVTITRPVEDALNTVQGLERVTSITSRGSAEIDLYFSWKSRCSRRSTWSTQRLPVWNQLCHPPRKSLRIG